jgi:hypothetical protein
LSESSSEDEFEGGGMKAMPLEGAYDPKAFENLNVKPDVRDLFKFITA